VLDDGLFETLQDRALVGRVDRLVRVELQRAALRDLAPVVEIVELHDLGLRQQVALDPVERLGPLLLPLRAQQVAALGVARARREVAEADRVAIVGIEREHVVEPRDRHVVVADLERGVRLGQQRFDALGAAQALALGRALEVAGRLLAEAVLLGVEALGEHAARVLEHRLGADLQVVTGHGERVVLQDHDRRAEAVDGLLRTLAREQRLALLHQARRAVLIPFESDPLDQDRVRDPFGGDRRTVLAEQVADRADDAACFLVVAVEFERACGVAERVLEQSQLEVALGGGDVLGDHARAAIVLTTGRLRRILDVLQLRRRIESKRRETIDCLVLGNRGLARRADQRVRFDLRRRRRVVDRGCTRAGGQERDGREQNPDDAAADHQGVFLSGTGENAGARRSG
jgi:hypothetical protein